MIKIVFSFKCIHTYACVTCYFLNNLINNLFFLIKLCLNLNTCMCLHRLHVSLV